MMVGHSNPHRILHSHRSCESSSSREERCSGSSTSNPMPSRNPSDYSLAMPSDLSDRGIHHSTTSLLDSIEKRTQRTYRYGIGLVCIGATLNWLGFAQGTAYHIDPLRYLGVACVLTGSFCVCISMCRWLGRPISVSGHHVASLEEERSADVHVINVPVPMYVPSLQEEYRPTKPPDYEQIVAGEPPPYDEAIKLSPGAFFEDAFTPSCPTSHLEDHHDSHKTPLISKDPPPAYEPKPNCSSSTTPLIPDLPPNFNVRIFQDSPVRRREAITDDHLQSEDIIESLSDSANI